MMKRYTRLICRLLPRHNVCAKCNLCVRLTGESPCNASEDLIKRIAGEHSLLPLHWVEKQINEELYRTALRKGGWVADIGTWGPNLFGKEASRMLKGMRPEFGYFKKRDECQAG